MRRLKVAAGGLALVTAGTLGTLAACGTAAEGIRVEGSPTATKADSDSSVVSKPPEGEESGDSSTTASPSPAPEPPGLNLTEPAPSNGFMKKDVDVITLLKYDPKVSSHVKNRLEPCTGRLWPVSVAYAQATGGPSQDLVVNVSSCSDKVGVGSYVYRRSTSGDLVNVFSAEKPPVHAEVQQGKLRVTRDVFLGNEPKCCPSGRDIITYNWQGGLFEEVDRRRTDAEGE